MKSILVLGGYGGTGRPMARWLLLATEARVIVAGRDGDKARQFAAELNGEAPGQRAAGLVADADKPESLRAAFRGVDLVLVCLPSIRHTNLIARLALEVGVDYLDIHFPAAVLPILERLGPDIHRHGRCFITQAGFHPGILAPLVKFAAPHFTRYDSAAIGMLMNFRYESSGEAAAQFIEEVCGAQRRIFTGGDWRRAGLADFRKFDYGPPFGVRSSAPLEFAEMHALPQQLGLREIGVYASIPNWFVNNLLVPLGLLLSNVRRGFGARQLGRWLIWGTKAFSGPPYGVVMRLEARGEKDGRPVSVTVELRHPDVYEFTAIPTVACLKQYLDGTIARPGLWLMGDVVEPFRLMQDMEDMGVRVETVVEGANHLAVCGGVPN
jgi:saccharopine dehydrogenase (NAD+, L-lysine-forming)